MQRYFAKDKKDNQFILEESDYHHIKNVMRMQDQEEIEVVYQNELYISTVLINPNIQIVEKQKLKVELSNHPQIELYIPLLKEQKMDFILQKATELGVDKIIPLETERSLIKLDKNKYLKKKVRWEKICKEASEQSKRTTLPIIGNITKIDELNQVKSVKLVCSTKEKTKNFKNIVKTNKDCDKISVVIGPEGGLSEKEEAKLLKNGFTPVTLGKRIMRVETVPLFILSAINYEYME